MSRELKKFPLATLFSTCYNYLWIKLIAADILAYSDKNIKFTKMENIYNGYENVMEFYVENIYESRMLLNEHQELLTQFWRTVDSKGSKRKMYLMSAGLVVGSVISIYRKSVVPGVTAAIPLGIETCRTLLTKYNVRFYKNSFLSFINALQDIFALAKNLKYYYQIRRFIIKNLSDDTKKLIEDMIVGKMLKLLSDVAKHVFELILFLKTNLAQIGNVIDIGDLNFMFTITIDEESFAIDESSEQTILDMYEKIKMAYVYVASTFFCGLGLSFCVGEWKSNNMEFMKIFSVIIPDCLQYAKNLSEEITKSSAFMFDSLQEPTANKKLIEAKQKGDKHLLSTVNTLRERVQVSFDIISSVEYQLMSYDDEKLLKGYVDDLENIFNECKETLKTLHYTVHKASTVKQESLQKTDENEISNDDDAVTINPEDEEEAIQDEEYNLSVHGSDHSDEMETSHLDHEQLLEYVKAQKLMIKELNDELRKRNIIKQTDITLNPTKEIDSNNKATANTAQALLELVVPPQLVTENTGTCNETTDNVANMDVNESTDTVAKMDVDETANNVSFMDIKFVPLRKVEV